MKFIVDAQLPYSLKTFLIKSGYNVIHTDDLPLKASTTDSAINEISKAQDRIVITKDTDFLDSYYVKSIPAKLLLVTTGNIINKDLFNLFTKNITFIIKAFNNHTLVEMDNEDLIIHE